MVANNAFMIKEMKEAELKKGLEQGLEKGLEQGLEQGFEKGERLKAIEIAKNLLDVLEHDIIALKTGLSIAEVKELRK
ncbi:MAG: hypothetical protein ACRC6T_17365 [Sarcina sp.]